MNCTVPRNKERGAAMLVVATLILALLAGGGVMVYMQLQSTRTATLVKSEKSALYCAEAGLAASVDILVNNVASWPALLAGNPANYPPWYHFDPISGLTGITGDLDNPPDGIDDYVVTVRDNDDELPPLPNDPTRDIDQRIFAHALCTKYPDTPREVIHLVQFTGGGHAYRNQSGFGSGGSGNRN
jgi:hypothetical protein